VIASRVKFLHNNKQVKIVVIEVDKGTGCVFLTHLTTTMCFDSLEYTFLLKKILTLSLVNLKF